MNQHISKQTNNGWVPRAGARSSEPVRVNDDRRDFIPLEESGIMPPSSDADVFDVRINNQQMLYHLYEDWAGMTLVKNDKGVRGFQKSGLYDGVEPPLSPRGARHVISLLKMVNNPSVLGKTSEMEHKVVRKHIMNSVAGWLADSSDVNMSFSERDNFYAFLEAYVNAQLSRTVAGHESKNLITTVREDRGEHSVTQSDGGKRGVFGFGSGKQ